MVNTSTLSKVEVKAIAKSEEQAIEQIKNCVGNIRESVIKIGQIITKSREKYGDGFINKLPKTLSKQFWLQCEAAACGVMDARLVFLSGNQYQRIRRYPKAVQTKILDNGVKLLVGNGDHLIVKVDNLNSEQINQVFDYQGVRDLAAQRAYVESNKERSIQAARLNSAANERPDWEIKDGALVINRAGVKLTKTAILEILGALVK